MELFHGRFLRHAVDDEHLPRLLQLAVFGVHFSPHGVFGLAQGERGLFDRARFLRRFALLASPIERLPAHRHAQAGDVFRQEVGVQRRNVVEGEADLGNELRLLDLAVVLGVLDLQLRLFDFRPPLQGLFASGGKVCFVAAERGDRADAEFGLRVAPQQLIELLLLRRQLIAQAERVVLRLLQPRADFQAVGFQRDLLDDVFAGHTVEFLIQPDRFLRREQRALRLENGVVTAPHVVDDRLPLQAQLLFGDLLPDAQLFQAEIYAVELRQRLIDLAIDIKRRTARRGNLGRFARYRPDARVRAERALLEGE